MIAGLREFFRTKPTVASVGPSAAPPSDADASSITAAGPVSPSAVSGEPAGDAPWGAAASAMPPQATASPAPMKLSILLANYNHGSMIGQCVQAVIDQTYPDWELIIIDDGSSDNSPAIISAFAAADKRITPFFFAENRGVVAAVRSGFAHVTGDLFFAVASDDFLVDRTFFATAVAELAARPEAAGVFGRCRVVDPDDEHELWTMGTAPAGGPNTAVASLQAFFDNKLFVPGASAIWRLPLIRAAGFYDPRLGPQSDYFLNHALPAIAEGVIFLDRVVAAVRASPGGYSSSATTEEFMRRHAMVEAKLRALPAMSAMDAGVIREWRFAIINARLNVTQQRGFFQKVKETAIGIAPYQRDNMPAAFLSMIETVAAECVPLEAELERRVASAAAVFDEVAGAVGGDPF
jgi:glycosyltransferase involved in cell wall biosynthesis